MAVDPDYFGAVTQRMTTAACEAAPDVDPAIQTMALYSGATVMAIQIGMTKDRVLDAIAETWDVIDGVGKENTP